MSSSDYNATVRTDADNTGEVDRVQLVRWSRETLDLAAIIEAENADQQDDEEAHRDPLTGPRNFRLGSPGSGPESVM